MSKKYSAKDFIELSYDKHGVGKYDYSKVIFKGMITEVIIGCQIHGDIYITPRNHLHTYGCQKCGKENRARKNRIREKNNGLSMSVFLKKSRNIHGLKYDYSNVCFDSIKDYIDIKCPMHGYFKQLVFAHIYNKQGCPQCWRETGIYHRNNNYDTIYFRNGGRKPISNSVFLNEAKKVHGTLYNYEKTALIDRYKNKNKVVIICSIHGDFMINPINHIRKKAGCPLCGRARLAVKNAQRSKNQRLDVEEFIKRSNKVHNNFYDYSLIKMNGLSSRVEILCPCHGSFWQMAKYHISGNGCQKCASNNRSKMEGEWLDLLGVGDAKRNLSILIEEKRIVPDAFDEETNTVYEFWGNYWHGNPKIYNGNEKNRSNNKTFGELYKDTLAKIDLYNSNGYNLVDIWESDWTENIRTSNENHL